MCNVTHQQLESDVRSLIRAQVTSLGIEVSLPVIYPGGDLISVVVAHTDGGCVVHDAGFGAMKFSSFGGKITQAMTRRISASIETYGCSFDGSRVSRTCDSTQLPVACAVVANASKIVADLALEIRRQTDSDFRYLVSDVLRDAVGSRLRQNETVSGFSGRTYKMPNLILDSSESRPIAYVVPVSSKSIVANCFSEMWDIQRLGMDVANDAIYNEDADIRAEDLNLLKQVSDTHPLAEARAQFLLRA